MKRGRVKWAWWVAGLILAAGTVSAGADTGENPYLSIVERNPFGLKDPPPPVSPEAEKPPVPMAKVTLTGVHSMFGPPRALLEVIPQEAGKAGTPEKPILREGERAGPVEVVSIDVTKGVVVIRNSGVETNLTFPVVESTKTASAAPGAIPPIALPRPGMPPGYMPPGYNPANPAATAHPAGPTVVTPGAAPRGMGVTVVGGGTAAAAPSVAAPTLTPGVPSVTPPVGASRYPSGAPAVYGGGMPAATTALPTPTTIPTPLGATDGGLKAIPSRPVRTDLQTVPPAPPLPPSRLVPPR